MASNIGYIPAHVNQKFTIASNTAPEPYVSIKNGEFFHFSHPIKADVINNITGESYEVLFEAIFALLTQKGIIQSQEEFIEVVEAVKFARKLAKE